jgi:signal transduction histidine kinase
MVAETDQLVADALARHEMSGERLTNRCRMAMLIFGAFDLALVWQHQTPAAARFFLWQGLFASAFVLAVAVALRDERRYLPGLKYITVVVDVTFAYVYTVASLLNHSGVYAVYRSPFMWLILATMNALSGLRYHAGVSVLAGLLTLSYGALQLFAVSLTRVEWVPRLEFVGLQLNFANCVQTIVLVSAPAWIAAAVAHRSRRLVIREAREAAERAAVEERHRFATRELEAANELARAKERFLNIAAHELRSPIAVLRSTVQLDQLDPAITADPARRAELLARLERQAVRLTRLVEQLLESARLGQELPLQRERCDLVQLCKSAVEALPGRERVRIDGPEAVSAVLDAMRIEQVLGNLVSNGLRYSPDSATVRVSVKSDEARAVVSVTDEGIGIDASQVERLFSPFSRTDQARRAAPGGLGLGLYIAREIVRRHGGSIRVESEPGRGSTFTVELPLDGESA